MNDDIMQQAGIYLLWNTASGGIYVGSAGQSFYIRFYSHISALRNNKHYNPWLQRSWNKHGESAFRFVIFEVIDDRDLIVSREQYWIDMFRTTHKIYNVAPTAQSMRGFRFSEESRKRMSEKQRGKKGKPPTEENRRILSEKAKLRYQNPEFAVRISKSIALSYTPELRKARSEKFQKTHLGTFISPSGERYTDIVNMLSFCNEHGLSSRDMFGLIKGDHFVHRGWTYLRPDGTPHPSHVKPQACECCGAIFQPLKASSYCSNACKSEARRQSGVDNVTKSCEVCGEDFVSNKYMKRCYCSRKCSAVSRIRR